MTPFDCITAALTGRAQQLPPAVVGRVHLIDEDAARHRAVSVPGEKKTKPHRAALTRQTSAAPIYRGSVERTLCVVKLMSDGRPRTLWDIAVSIGAPNTETLRPLIDQMVDLGILQRIGRQSRDSARGAHGSCPMLFAWAAVA